MLFKQANDIPSSEITDESIFRNRREFLKKFSTVAGAGTLATILPTGLSAGEPLQAAKAPGKYDTDEPRTS